jgi:hypothetical protein
MRGFLQKTYQAFALRLKIGVSYEEETSVIYVLHGAPPHPVPSQVGGRGPE